LSPLHATRVVKRQSDVKDAAIERYEFYEMSEMQFWVSIKTTYSVNFFDE
jgi:hypothetical protein